MFLDLKYKTHVVTNFVIGNNQKIPKGVANFVVVFSSQRCMKINHLILWMKNNLNNINDC